MLNSIPKDSLDHVTGRSSPGNEETLDFAADAPPSALIERLSFMPNSAQKLMPNNSQSDTQKTQLVSLAITRHNPLCDW